MALLRNGSSLAMLPIRQIGGGVHADLSMWNRSERRNSSTAFSPLAGIPYGHLAPSSWLLPVKPGGMSSYCFAEIDVASSGAANMGAPVDGQASMVVSVPDAEAQLIANGAGVAGFSVQPNAMLSASINGAGSSTVSFSVTAALGAIVSVSGDTALSFGTTASILPTNDASPLRTGSASITVTGTLQPYATGIMAGSTVDSSTLTTQAISSAVWKAVASEFTDTGTMGSKLNTASSGGVDIGTLVDAIVVALNNEVLPVNIAKVNGVTVKGSGTQQDPWNPE